MGLDIVVCLKQVPHPEHLSRVSLDPVTKTMIRHGIPTVINPPDRNAIEEGLKIKERFSGKVVAISMGPLQAKKALEEALAMGVDKAILLCDRAFAGADTLATAYTLSYAIQKLGYFDLILCGNETVDSGTSQVPPQLAEFLNIPHVTQVKEIRFVNEKAVVVKRALKGGYMRIQLQVPAVLAVVKEINKPRLPTVARIIEVAQKEITTWGLAALGVADNRVGLAGSPTRVIDIFKYKSSRRGEILQGLPEEVVREAIKRLQELEAL